VETEHNTLLLEDARQAMHPNARCSPTQAKSPGVLHLLGAHLQQVLQVVGRLAAALAGCHHWEHQPCWGPAPAPALLLSSCGLWEPAWLAGAHRLHGWEILFQMWPLQPPA
jgi:hypothetical protein